MKSHKAVMHKCLGEFYYNASYAMAESSKSAALALFARGVWHKAAIQPMSIKILLKILTPVWVLNVIRRLRVSENRK